MSIIKPLGVPGIKPLGLSNTEGVENPSEKILHIKFLSFKEEEGLINLEFEVEAKGLNSSEGILSLFKAESLGFYFEGFSKQVKISNGISRVKFNLDRYSSSNIFTNEKNKYYVLIAVNGISKRSDNFDINLKTDYSTSFETKLTANHLSQMGVPAKTAQKYIKDLNATFDRYEINTPLRKISFFGQVLSETEAFRIKTENGVSDTAYGGFKGRGCMQLTGKENYVGYEEYKKKDLPNIDFTSTTSNKNKVNDLPYYLDSGGWFWSIRTKLNDDADINDFIYIAFKVNGGFNHFDKRVEYYIKAAKVLDKRLVNPIFNFRTSACFNIQKACCAWGLWHDPASPEDPYFGVKRDTKEAILGYTRFLELHTKAGRPKIKEMYDKIDYQIINFVDRRLNSLKQ
ncbi:hypothetical protein LZQ00_08615 [Sphingobacterium sp. SRCM116780]|uniref:glycoside hydrolase family 19 protein n=1 Tax=Sphingobacterium sp. SRCM116780 TaxID=2907623 RepID=UPI001F1E136A|nr:hypothetical protein [Sphingobacterium sp. SRCM116780]UIR57868.1 hypothetical protein LZQ00_08615 [Sphingobacterium sp. SRCM116780]